MQLRSTIVAIIIAAAAGGSAVRVFSTQSSTGEIGLAHGERAMASFDMKLPAGGPERLPPARPAQPGPASKTAIVYVAGAVLRPGVYALALSARANDALRAAGGPARNADLVAVNLAARVADGDEIAVPVRGATEGPGGDGTPGATVHRRRGRARGGSQARRRRKPRVPEGAGSSEGTDSAASPSDIVDVNAATEAELETLPGVGPSLAERIVAFRDLNGPFASADELLDVGGMTAAKVDALSPYAGFR